MATVLVFDIETIPDVVGLRRLEDFPDSMTDSQVAAKVMTDRAEKLVVSFCLYIFKKFAPSPA